MNPTPPLDTQTAERNNKPVMTPSSGRFPLFSSAASAEPVTQIERDRAVNYLRETLKENFGPATPLTLEPTRR